MKNRLLIVPSTHWDREWYKTQAEFCVYLTELFELVLDKLESGELENFFADGQTVIVEDIVKLKPQWRERIARFASQGKLELGPFYALSDMYMPSGESFFRNISYGIEFIRELGGKPGIPYAPDAFGHNADVPAILNSAGFDSYFFCRGLGGEIDPVRSEFIWEDKNKLYKLLALSGIVDLFHPVTGRWISGAYALAMNLPQEQSEFNERLQMIWDSLGKYTDLPVRLAINGSDHLLPEKNLAGRLADFNQTKPDFTAECVTIAEFVRSAWENLDVEKLPKISGELLSGRFFNILTGTSSSRVKLKQLNRQCEFLLEKIVEPAMAAAPENVRIRYQEHVDNAWKMLLQNQTHDSICGCSVDAVHREMVVRYEKILCSMTAVAERLLRLKANVAQYQNLMPLAGAEVINLAVTSNGYDMLQGTLKRLNFAIPHNIDLNEYSLCAADGNEYDFIAAIEQASYTTNGPFIPAGPQLQVLDRVNIYTDMPLAEGCSATEISFKRNVEKSLKNSDRSLPVFCKNGKLVLETPHYSVEDFLTLVDTTDVGDEYNYRPGDAPFTCVNTPWQEVGKVIAGNIYMAEFASSVIVPLCRNAAEKVELPVKLKITGAFGDDAFTADIAVDNQAKDHRLQLHITAPFEFKEYCRETQFNHIITAVERRNEGEDWREKTEPLRRNFGHVSITGKGKEFAFMPYGLHEHTTDGRSFDLTLLRAVSILGSNGSGPVIETPDAQMTGRQTFQIAFTWNGYGENSNTLWKKKNRLLDPVYAAVLTPETEVEKLEQIYYQLDSDKLLVSACMFDKALDKNIIRIFNPSAEKASGKLTGKLVTAVLHKVIYKNGSAAGTAESVPADNITLNAGEIATFALG